MPDIKELRKSDNIAELLSEEELAKISSQVIKGYEVDIDSRGEWEETIDKAMDIAKQTIEKKNHPWPNSANVKYPLITQASIDFASRTFPEIVQNDKVVKVKVVGQDVNDEKHKRGRRVASFMSYQLLHVCKSWEEELDRMLHVLPVLGTVFKKTYFDPIKDCPQSELCNPKKIVVNHNVKSLEEARRITHQITFYSNDVVERIRAGLYRDVDLEKLMGYSDYTVDEIEEDLPLELLEQHCYLDLDKDGYAEPYIVVLHKESGEILRIVNRFEKIKYNSKDEVQSIIPEHYFTDFHFIKSPDGGFYSVGLGSLLYPINKAINTLINQLLDSGTINNMQGGFVGRGLRLRNGEFKFKMGEWKVLDSASGTNLAQNIFPVPTKEPSGTLFQLLGSLIEMGKDLSSVNDVLQGKQPAQNVPATTILTLVEQGMKVFNAVNKRIFRGLRKEFQKVYKINKKHLTQKEYIKVLDMPNANVKIDFEEELMDILPVADPNMASDAQRLVKAQALLSMPALDPYATTKYYLEALQVDDEKINELLPQPDPNAPPPPEALKIMAEVDKLQAQAKALLSEAQVNSHKTILDATKLELQERDTEARIDESAARIMKMKEDAINNNMKLDMVASKSEAETIRKDLEFLHDKEKDEIELSAKMIESSKKLDIEEQKVNKEKKDK